MGGGGGLQNKHFSALWASVWTRRKGRAGPPGPFPGSATELRLESVSVITEHTTLPSVVEIPCQHSLPFACSNLLFSRKTA